MPDLCFHKFNKQMTDALPVCEFCCFEIRTLGKLLEYSISWYIWPFSAIRMLERIILSVDCNPIIQRFFHHSSWCGKAGEQHIAQTT